MKIIINNNTNPYFNLAAEEYVLKNFSDECFMLWRNESCIVVGKHQNTLSQINETYVNLHNIPVVRRLSGGGTVFHDLGNLNFTFVKNNANDSFNDFKKFTQPIVDVLITLGLDAQFSGRNDITIDSKKISGNAQYKYQNRIFHHGTLLFSSNIKDLSPALKYDKEKFKDKSVKSIKSRVTNISNYLCEPMNINEFKNLIINHILSTHKCELYNFTDTDVCNINNLVENKYSKWLWNYGTSPNYTYKNKLKFNGGLVEVYLVVKKGIITSVNFYGDFFSKNGTESISSSLIDTHHTRNSVKTVLSQFCIDDYFSSIKLDELIQVICDC